MADDWKERQDAAIKRQREFYDDLENGSDPQPVPDVEGNDPQARYTKGESLWLLGQIRNCIEAGARLPNAGLDTGLTFEPGADRQPLDDQTRKDYPALAAKIQRAGNYSDEELDAVDALIAENLANGVSLDPATSRSV